jgi:hypothetical protein
VGALYEVALTEWHITPEYINEQWTEELFELMFRKRNERLRKNRPQNKQQHEPEVPKITNDLFFQTHGLKVKRF